MKKLTGGIGVGAVVLALLVGPVSAANAADPTTPGTALPVSGLPSHTDASGVVSDTWTAVTDPANQRVADACLPGRQLATPHWVELLPASPVTVTIRADVASTIGRDAWSMSGGVAVVSRADLHVIACATQPQFQDDISSVLDPRVVGPEGIFVVAFTEAGTPPADPSDAYVQGGYGHTEDLYIDTVPGAPEDLFVNRDDAAHTAQVVWYPPVNGAGIVTSYRVSRDGTDSGNTGPWSTVVPAELPGVFTFRYLNSWDTYHLSIQAINAVGTGPAATIAVTLTAPTPSAPTGVTASPANHAATVHWSTPAHSGSSTITGYRIRRFVGNSTTAQATTTVPATAHSLTATGLTNGTSYRFDVTAVNSGGAGRISPRTPAVVPASVPGVPTAVSATKNDAAGTATITWSPPSSTGGSAITGYRVARDGNDSGDTGPWSTVVAPGTHTLTFRYLNPGETYDLTVQAINAVGSGPAAQSTVTITAPSLRAR